MPQMQQEDAQAELDVEDLQIEQNTQNLQPKIGNAHVILSETFKKVM